MSLAAHHVTQIERALGRPLAPPDLEPVATIEQLRDSQVENIRLIARQSRPLAVAYIHALVGRVRVGESVALLEKLGLT